MPAAHPVPQRDLRLIPTGSRRWALALALAAGCGARTGLDVPDVATFPDLPDASDVADARDVRLPPTCIPGRFTLTQRPKLHT